MNDKLNMTEAEKKALSAMNRALSMTALSIFNVSGEVPFWAKPEPVGRRGTSYIDWLRHDDGNRAAFNLKAGQHSYLYYDNKKGTKRFCYTPWKDTKGFYWYWTDTIKKTKAGGAYWKESAVVKVRKRKTARARAYSRFEKGK